MSFSPGDTVRLVHDPARVGVLTKNRRAVAGQQNWFVQFPTGPDWVPEDQLEPADVAKDPLDLLVAGTLSPASDLRRVLTHARLSGRLQDVIYSLFTTRTDFYPHQFKPILRLLTGVSDGILIADEVGLGKTIEAGLIWTELRTRFEYDRLFVLCPAVLCKKWQMELSNRFGIRAEIVNAEDAHNRLRLANSAGPGEGFALIGSMQGLRPPKDWRMIQSPPRPSIRLAEFLEQRGHEEPLVDMLVIDEAHHMRNSETATSELGQLLRAVSSQVVLLSATPVNLKNEDLFTLMRIVDPDTFSNAWEFADILRANQPLVAARDRVLRGPLPAAEFIGLMNEARAHPVLSESRTLSWLIEHPPTDEQLEDPRSRAELAHQLDQANLLGQVVNRTRKRDVQEHRIIRKAVAQRVELSEAEATFYRRVTEGVREFYRKQGNSAGFMLTTPQRLMASSIPAALRHWGYALQRNNQGLSDGIEDEDDAQVAVDDTDGTGQQMGALVADLVVRIADLGGYEALRHVDSKYRHLEHALRTYFGEHPVAKVILFTTFRATLHYLDERLREAGFETTVMHGDTDDKDAVIDRVREHPRGMVLLSSEVGSEGVDLQFARLVINYDLPWNPMRVEQRIGRLDRLGQQAGSIAIWNLFCANTIDERIHDRLFLRIGIFESALGGLEPILGEPIERLTRELLRDRLTPEQEAERIEAAAIAIENNRKSIEQLEDNASQFFALGDYLLERVRDAERLGRHIQAEDLRNYVVEFLHVHHPGAEMHSDLADPLALQLRLKPDAKVALEDFLRRHRLGRVTRLTLASSGPVNCRFENTVIETDGRGEELISQFHPLVRYARERLSASESDLRLAVAAQVAVADLPEPVPPGTYAFAIERWCATGVQQVEKLAYEVVRVDDLERLPEDQAELLVNRVAGIGSSWPEAVSEVDLASAGKAGEHCLGRLLERYENFERTLRHQNEDRSNALLTSLERQVNGQVGRIEAVNDRLRAAARTGLVAANEGRIKKLRERAEMRRCEIEGRTRISTQRTLFLMGVIGVQG